MKLPIETRILNNSVIEENDCWIWTLAKSSYGYGWIKVDGRMLIAHRVAYEIFKGPIPEGLTIDHLCRRHSCVNPDHLEAVTHRENTIRGVSVVAENARKTHCPKGHAFTPENTYVHPVSGGRRCRRCRYEQDCAKDGREPARGESGKEVNFIGSVFG